MAILDYQPRSGTRAPGSVPPGTIGVLSLDPSPLGKAFALREIQRATQDSDYFASTVSVPPPDRGSLLTALERLRRPAVQGILVVAAEPAELTMLAEICADIPLVAVAADPHGGLSGVAIDDYSGAAAATRHLLDLGHRTVFHIAGPGEHRNAGLRFAGWRDTLLAADADVPPCLVGDWSPGLGYELGSRLGARTDVTAVFVANDQMAIGVMRALCVAGRRVPQDVSVVGFDGIAEGEFLSPPLTTVQHDVAEIARRSFELLRSEIETGRRPAIHETIPADLILRASTAAAR